MTRSAFVISLDLELYWGVRDVVSIDAYRANLEGVRFAVPRMLALFAEHGVHATWATVGLLGLHDTNDAASHAPSVLPDYVDRTLCPYDYLRDGGAVSNSGVHFAPELLEAILKTKGQELATHTFSHFYCLEEPVSLAAFRADLEAARAAARERFGVSLTSLVFPRNQYSPAHVRVAGEVGITAYRGNPDRWMYAPRVKGGESMVRRGARLADAYLPVARDMSFALPSAPSSAPVNVPASRFLRPWSASLAWADGFGVRRVEREMEAAARHGRGYHLWWHPHNFGQSLEANVGRLERVLRRFDELRRELGMESRTMAEVATAEAESEVARDRDAERSGDVRVSRSGQSPAS